MATDRATVPLPSDWTAGNGFRSVAFADQMCQQLGKRTASLWDGSLGGYESGRSNCAKESGARAQ